MKKEELDFLDCRYVHTLCTLVKINDWERIVYSTALPARGFQTGFIFKITKYCCLVFPSGTLKF